MPRRLNVVPVVGLRWLALRRGYTTETPEIRQYRLANLGETVRRLEQALPPLLRSSLPGDLVHPNVVFEVFPETHGFQVAGITAYRTTVKLLQLAVTSLLVPNETQLQILSMRLDEPKSANGAVHDRHLHINWRTMSPDRSPAPRRPIHVWEPGRIIESLGRLLPDEYPVLAGTFEFGFDEECSRILLHVIRNVEYLSRPDSQLICT